MLNKRCEIIYLPQYLVTNVKQKLNLFNLQVSISRGRVTMESEYYDFPEKQDFFQISYNTCKS